jgi:hypothetical protein
MTVTVRLGFSHRLPERLVKATKNIKIFGSGAPKKVQTPMKQKYFNQN